MKFDIQEKEKDPQFPFTAKKILSLMQDKETSKVDLLVREVIQNSADAIASGKDYGNIWFKLNDFNTHSLIDCLGSFGYSFCQMIPTNQEVSKCLVLLDSNTVGLCGCPYENKSLKRNNLFNLVYNVLGANKEFDAGSGGSHGIGKTVYFHYGKSLVFFYSHAKEEDGSVHHKLSGLFLEDNSKANHVLSEDSSGIVLFGKNGEYNGKEISEPITNETIIKEFLDVLGVSMYSDSSFGTTILIPFVTPEQFKLKREASFATDLYEMLGWSVQRWYFPRINNPGFIRPYIKCKIGGSYLELNPLFAKLQCLYNVDVLSIHSLNEYDVNIYKDKNEQGYFYYYVFTKKELGVGIPPENYPDPFEQIYGHGQKNEHCPIFAYVRNPGMIINYDFNDKIKLSTKLKEGEYLFGLFVVNPNCVDKNGKTLDDYFKKSEKDNHKQWSDLKDDDEFEFSKQKIFKKIYSEIKKELERVFGDKPQIEETTTVAGHLQRLISKTLLPPDDFGQRPSKPVKKAKYTKLGGKTHSFSVSFTGFTSPSELPTYSIRIPFGDKEKETDIVLSIMTEHKKVNSFEWENYGFKMPFKIHSLILKQYSFSDSNKTFNANQTLDLNLKFNKLNNADYGAFATIEVVRSKSGCPCKIKINKLNTKCGVTLELFVLIETMSLDYQIGFDCI